MSINQTKDGVTITIFVKTNAPKFSIELDNDEIIVHSSEETKRGKVNREIQRELTKLFKSPVKFVSGLTSRQKVLLIMDANKTQVRSILKSKETAKQAD
jgi:uncharacterized protein (TIGR00251 family)